MKRFVTIAVLSLLSSQAFAVEKATMNLCTGSKDGVYWPLGEAIKNTLSRTIRIANIETNGTEDNYQKADAGECDGFIGQNDARQYMEKKNPDLVQKLEYVSYLTKDWVHLICNREAGISKIKDFYDSKKELVIGSPGTGGFITWTQFGIMEPRYTKIRTQDVDFETGLMRVKQNDVACMLWVAGLNSNKMKRINDQGKGLLQLIPLNDGDLDNATDSKGKPLYVYDKIPGGTYYNLQYGMLGTSVKTLYQNNVLVVTKKWASENRKAFGELNDVASRIYQQNN